MQTSKKLQVVVFGEHDSGKSTLIKQLLDYQSQCSWKKYDRDDPMYDLEARIQGQMNVELNNGIVMQEADSYGQQGRNPNEMFMQAIQKFDMNFKSHFFVLSFNASGTPPEAIASAVWMKAMIENFRLGANCLIYLGKIRLNFREKVQQTSIDRYREYFNPIQCVVEPQECHEQMHNFKSPFIDIRTIVTSLENRVQQEQQVQKPQQVKKSMQEDEVKQKIQPAVIAQQSMEKERPAIFGTEATLRDFRSKFQGMNFMCVTYEVKEKKLAFNPSKFTCTAAFLVQDVQMNLDLQQFVINLLQKQIKTVNFLSVNDNERIIQHNLQSIKTELISIDLPTIKCDVV